MVQGAANDVNNVTAVVWGLAAMTKIGQFRHSGERMQSLWYVVAPAAGSSTITFTATFDILAVAAVCYSGASQTGQPDSFATFDATTTTSVNATTTVVASDCWLVAGNSFSSGSITDIASSPGGPRGTPSDNGTYYDSDGTVSTGSQSLALSWTNNSSAWGVVASIAPATAPAGPTNLKSLDTNVKANIKSYNTNVLANIKSINTNA